MTATIYLVYTTGSMFLGGTNNVSVLENARLSLGTTQHPILCLPVAHSRG